MTAATEAPEETPRPAIRIQLPDRTIRLEAGSYQDLSVFAAAICVLLDDHPEAARALGRSVRSIAVQPSGRWLVETRHRATGAKRFFLIEGRRPRDEEGATVAERLLLFAAAL